jgi:hypothetical protein
MDFSQQPRLIENIKQKIHQHNATITEEDKGKTMVIPYKQTLNEKVNQFINDNQIETLQADPTQKMQRQIQKALKHSSTLFNQNKKKLVLQMNLTAPTLRAKIKIHKPQAPNRPVINNINAPSYKLATHTHHILTGLLKLKYEFNCPNSTTFAEDITKIHIEANHKLLTLDITYLYVNIPIDDTINMTKQLLKGNNTDDQHIKEVINILKTILNQNYFQYNRKFYKPKTGITMGCPLSGTIAEIFIQHLEQQTLKHTLESQAIIYYTRYVDDIFIIYNQNKITPEQILEQFNKQHKALQFTITEENKQIPYLDLNITNKLGTVGIGIYRKPTMTDIVISNSSCHPGEQKMATFKNWLHRLHKLPLSELNKEKELNTTINIAKNNGYNRQQIIKIDNTIKQSKHKNNSDPKQKWVSFTFSGNYVRTITKLFKNTNINIAFKTNNTIGNVLKKEQLPTNMNKQAYTN